MSKDYNFYICHRTSLTHRFFFHFFSFLLSSGCVRFHLNLTTVSNSESSCFEIRWLKKRRYIRQEKNIGNVCLACVTNVFRIITLIKKKKERCKLDTICTMCLNSLYWWSVYICPIFVFTLKGNSYLVALLTYSKKFNWIETMKTGRGAHELKMSVIIVFYLL